MEDTNPHPKYPAELTDKEKEVLLNYQRLKDLEAEVGYYDKGPYLVGMSEEGAFAFYFPDSSHLGKHVKRNNPVFDPDQPQLPIPRYSFKEYFRTKAQKEQEEEERSQFEEEEKAAWRKLRDQKDAEEGKTTAASEGVAKNYRIKIDSLGMTGTRLIVQDFEYLPPGPDDDPSVRKIAVRSERTIEHPNLKYRGFNSDLN